MTFEKRVLVVEDDPGVREVIVATLEDAGYSVQSARDGAEALSLVDSEEPDVITLDLNMPVMDGRSFYQALRDHGHASKVLVVSGAVNLLDQSSSFQPDAYLRKPFDIDQLVHHVGELTLPS